MMAHHGRHHGFGGAASKMVISRSGSMRMPWVRFEFFLRWRRRSAFAPQVIALLINVVGDGLAGGFFLFRLVRRNREKPCERFTGVMLQARGGSSRGLRIR